VKPPKVYDFPLEGLAGAILSESSEVQFILVVAMNLCPDYMVPIEAAISGIRHYPGLIR
jgi:hypothetical protein